MKNKFLVESACKLSRKGVIVELKKLEEDSDKTEGTASKGLANIGVHNSRFWIYDPAAGEQKEDRDKLYLSLRKFVDDTGNPGIQIYEGDIIKLGKSLFEVHELVERLDVNDIIIEITEPLESARKFTYPEEEDSSLEDSKIIQSPTSEKKHEKRNEGNHCRICLGDDNTVENPLFPSPCKCIGSIQLVHVECLKQWLNSKLTKKKTEFVETYVWKPFECDVCKMRYPDIILGPNKKPINIFSIKKPKNHYMILRSIVLPTDRLNNQIHIINLQKKNLLGLGRANENEVQIYDISVSREHAQLRINNGNVFLCDNNSKYGTLLLLKRPVFLNPANLHTFQAGRTLLSFSARAPSCSCRKPEIYKLPDTVPTIEELIRPIQKPSEIPEVSESP